MSGKGHFKETTILDNTEGTVLTTDAVLEAHSIKINPSEFVHGGAPKITAWKSGGLGAIVVLLWEKVNGNWGQVFKDGAAVELSATNPQEAFQAYGTYGVSKADATTGVDVTVTKIR